MMSPTRVTHFLFSILIFASPVSQRPALSYKKTACSHRRSEISGLGQVRKGMKISVYSDA